MDIVRIYYWFRYGATVAILVLVLGKKRVEGCRAENSISELDPLSRGHREVEVWWPDTDVC